MTVATHLLAEITPTFANMPRLHKLTYDEFAGRVQPCWIKDGRESELRSAWGSRETATVLDVITAYRAGAFKASIEDVLWVVLQPAWYAEPDVVLRWLAADFSAHVLPIYEKELPDDGRPRAAIEAARAWAACPCEEHRLAAYAAARAADAAAADAYAADAAYSAADAVAADAAAAYAAYYAAYYASAAYSAADAAADAAAAYAAAYSADAAAEREWQLDRVAAVLRWD